MAKSETRPGQTRLKANNPDRINSQRGARIALKDRRRKRKQK